MEDKKVKMYELFGLTEQEEQEARAFFRKTIEAEIASKGSFPLTKLIGLFGLNGVGKKGYLAFMLGRLSEDILR